MPEIKAKETYYNGYKFRSRLEAKWAVFFDDAGIRYEYEPEGYLLQNGKSYLPDFYLPDFDVHVEVKRDTIDGRQEILDKCVNAIQWGGPIKQILILSDVPEGKSIDGGIWHFPFICWNGDKVDWTWWFFHDEFEGVTGQPGSRFYPDSFWLIYNEYNKRRTNSINAVSDYELRKYYRSNSCFPSELSLEDEIFLQEDFNSNTFRAFRTARQARFEHGERPLTERI